MSEAHRPISTSEATGLLTTAVLGVMSTLAFGVLGFAAEWESDTTQNTLKFLAVSAALWTIIDAGYIFKRAFWDRG